MTGVIGEAGSRSTVAQPVPMTPMDLGAGPANNSPQIAVDPTNSRFVVTAHRLDAPDFACAFEVSGDSGSSWVSDSPLRELPAGADKCYAAEAVFDRDGTLYYLFVGLQGAGNQPMGAFLTSSRDRARTWTPPQPVLGPHNFGVRIAIDGALGSHGRIHLAWLHADADPPTGGFDPGPNHVMTAHSDDGGRTFSPPITVSDQARQRVVAPVLALGGGHRVAVGYYDLGNDARDYQGLDGPVWDGTWSIVVAVSSDGGRNFSPGSVAEPAVVPPERVMLIFTMPPPALVARGSGFCLAWSDARNGDADVFLRCSSGGTWGTSRRINDDPVGNGLSQYLPALSVAPGGRLDAVFYDRRRDPDNVGTDVYYAYSTNGGRTFSRNQRLNRFLFDSRIGQTYAVPSAKGKTEFGSGLGLLSGRRLTLVVWPDTHLDLRSSQEQDLYAARLTAPSGSRTHVLAGATLIVAGLFVLSVVVIVRLRQTRDGSPARQVAP